MASSRGTTPRSATSFTSMAGRPGRRRRVLAATLHREPAQQHHHAGPCGVPPDRSPAIGRATSASSSGSRRSRRPGRLGPRPPACLGEPRERLVAPPGPRQRHRPQQPRQPAITWHGEDALLQPLEQRQRRRPDRPTLTASRARASSGASSRSTSRPRASARDDPRAGAVRIAADRQHVRPVRQELDAGQLVEPALRVRHRGGQRRPHGPQVPPLGGQAGAAPRGVGDRARIAQAPTDRLRLADRDGRGLEVAAVGLHLREIGQGRRPARASCAGRSATARSRHATPASRRPTTAWQPSPSTCQASASQARSPAARSRPTARLDLGGCRGRGAAPGPPPAAAGRGCSALARGSRSRRRPRPR